MSVITIDGPAGAGKSTIARELACRLGWLYLDTGAMYRAMAWLVKDAGITPDDEAAISGLCERVRIGFTDGRVMVNGKDVSTRIRTPEIDILSSRVSRISAVRHCLTRLQREIASAGDVIAEGRDMGTVVFPQALYKFFLVAPLEVRAARRKMQLDEAGCHVPYSEVLARMEARDRADSSRDLSPLQAAHDSIRIDSSDLGPGEIIDLIMGIVAGALTHPCPDADPGTSS